MSPIEPGDSKTPGVRRLRLLPEAKILEVLACGSCGLAWCILLRLCMQALSQPPHATRSHTPYMHVSLIDAFGSTSCHRPGTVSHCALPPWQTPRLEIGLLPPSFSRLLQIFLNKDLPSAQVIRLSNSSCFVLATLVCGA